MGTRYSLFDYLCMVLIFGGMALVFVACFASSSFLGCLGAGALFTGVGLLLFIKENVNAGLLLLIVGVGIFAITLIPRVAGDLIDREQLEAVTIPVALLSVFIMAGCWLLWESFGMFAGRISGGISNALACALVGILFILSGAFFMVGVLSGSLAMS